MENKVDSGESSRRRFVGKLAKLAAAAGIGGVILAQLKEKGGISPAYGAPGAAVIIDAIPPGVPPVGGNVGVATTWLDSNTNLGGTFVARNAAAGPFGEGLIGITENLALPPPVPAGVYGLANAGVGVKGDSATGFGVEGYASAGSGQTVGVYGSVESTQGYGVQGYAKAGSGSGNGVFGVSDGWNGIGVRGWASSGSGLAMGVFGESDSEDGVGIFGFAGNVGTIPIVALGTSGQTSSLQEWQVSRNNTMTTVAVVDKDGHLGVGTSSPAASVDARTASATGIGIFGYATAASGLTIGVQGTSNTPQGMGVWGVAGNAGAIPIVAQGASSQTANLQEWRNNSSTRLAVVDKDGKLGVGTDAPVTAVQVIRPASWANADPLIRLDGDAYNVGAFFYAYGSGNFPFFSGRRSRGNQASPSAVQSGDLLMRYGGAGYGTNAFPSGNRAMLDFYAAENWSNTTQGTYVTISTTATGASAPTEKVRVTGDGSVLPPSDNTGSIGKVGQRWNLVRAQTVTSGDLVYENGVRSTEDGDGIAFYNPHGVKIARLDANGNIHIKGKLISDL